MNGLATHLASRISKTSRFPALTGPWSCRHQLQARTSTSNPRRPGKRRFLRGPCGKLHGRRRRAARRADQIRRDYPVSLHGVCMSIGGPRPLDKVHLARFKALVERYEPALVSEHLAWSTHDSVYYNDLLPVPYTPATLSRVADHIDEVQEAIGRPMLLENPSSYVAFPESTMSETDFIREMVAADRLRPAARRQQRLRLGHQSPLFGAILPRQFPARTCRRNPSRRPCQATG